MSDKHLTANELAQNIQENVDNVVAAHNKSEATSALQAETNELRDNANLRRSVRSDLSTGNALMSQVNLTNHSVTVLLPEK